MKNEPLITVASITAGVTALLALLVAFNVPVTPEQQVAILGVVAVAAPIVVAVIGRSLVTPNANVVEYTTSTNQVRAGEANELPTDTKIRMLDTDPGGHLADHGGPGIVDNPYDEEGDAL